MIVQLPNGETAEFPDNMKPAEIEAVLQKQFPAPTSQTDQVASIPEIIGKGLQGDPMAESLNMFQPKGAVQELGRMGTEYAPEIGLLAGGAIGSLGGPLSIPAAGMGYAGGDMFKRAMQGQAPATDLQDITNMGKGMAYEAGGQVVSKLISGALAPGRKWLGEQLASVGQHQALQDLASQGVPVSPAEIAPSKTAKAVSWLAERFQPGKSIVNHYRQRTMDMIMEMRRNLIEDLGLPSVGSMPLGQAKDTIATVFKNFREAAGPDTAIPLPKTAEFVNNLSEEKMGKSGVEYLGKLREALKTGEASVPQIESMNAGLWPKGRAYSRMSTLDRNWRDEFLGNLYEDLGAHESAIGVNLAELLKTAKGTTRQIYQAQTIEKLLDRATNNDTLEFNPRFFYDLVQKNQTRLQRSLDKDIANNLFSFAEKMKLLGPERQLMKRGAQQSYFEQAVGGLPALGLGSAAYMSGSPALAIPVGFQALVARSLMAPRGIVRKWLTTGFAPPKLVSETGAKIGLMEAGKND